MGRVEDPGCHRTSSTTRRRVRHGTYAPCSNHMIDTQQFFAAKARGEDAPFPSATPPALIGDDPGGDLRRNQAGVLRAHREPGVLDKTGPMLGIALCDQLVHGWDLATATGQDATMPEDLAEAAFAVIDGRLTDEQRGAVVQASGRRR